MKASILLFALVLSLSIVAAAPQVIFTSVNMTIISNCTSISYTLSGEGIIATDSFPTNINVDNSTNCTGNSSYVKFNIPMTFSRDIAQNETDMGILLHSLAINNNISSKWLQCIAERNALNDNLTFCELGQSYVQNYTDCQNQYNICDTTRTSQANQITKSNQDLTSKKSWQWIYAFAGIAGVVAAIYFYNKQKTKTVEVPQRKWGNPTGAM